MDELKIPEERNDPEKTSGWPFSKKSGQRRGNNLKSGFGNARGYIF